jgi:hypothetical protein
MAIFRWFGLFHHKKAKGKRRSTNQFISLKGWNMKAQGNALGSETQMNCLVRAGQFMCP